MQSSQKTNWLVPVSIIVAGGLVAFSLYITRKDTPTTQVANNEPVEINLSPITAEDHILGNPNATVTLVEYSDPECPYCARFHPTMHRLVNEYGKDGKLSWIYRNFVQVNHTQYHPKATKEANAAECVAAIAGNESYWKFIDLLYTKKDFAAQPYVGLDPKELPTLAASVGADKAKVADCINKETYVPKLLTEQQQAVEAGALGTPFTIAVLKKPVSRQVEDFIRTANPQIGNALKLSKDKTMIGIDGAMPYEILKPLMDLLVQG